MDKTKIDQLLDLMVEIVNQDGPWMDKAKAVLLVANDEQKVALLEFSNWFGEGDVM